MQPLNLNSAGICNNFVSELPSVTGGMFFSGNRLYYTKTNGTQLFYRQFTPQSNTFGPQTTGVQSSGGSIDFSKVGGCSWRPTRR